jgi:diguanylate cyclase (GGDEF)-like protein
MTVEGNETMTTQQAVFRTTDRTPTEGAVKASSPRGVLHDPITGLANKHFLLASLRLAAQKAALQEDSPTRPTVIVLKVDRIAHVAACFGARAQKRVLEAVARRLESLTPPTGKLARTGDEEFCFLIEASHPSKAAFFATQVETQLQRPIDLDGNMVLPTARIGIATWHSNGQEILEILHNARLAAASTEPGARAGVLLFNAAQRDEAIDRMQLEAELSVAVERGELRLDYQPMMSIETGTLTGLEALVRWEHPLHGTILPDEFIPLAEETGLINPIGDWVLTEACRQMALWQARFNAETLKINVNLSARQLEQPDLVQRVLRAQKSTGLRAGTLRLELTETTVISNEQGIERLQELRENGIEIQLDDFGSGYSSLGYLGRLPIDSLKLDRSFVEQSESDERSAMILDAVVTLARELDLAVTAEGIETHQQAERIRSLACETGQGYFFHRPLAGTAVESLLVA